MVTILFIDDTTVECGSVQIKDGSVHYNEYNEYLYSVSVSLENVQQIETNGIILYKLVN